MKAFSLWIKAIGIWMFVEWWRVWLSVGLLVLIFSPLLFSLDDRLRYGGWLFELLGIGTVAHGLRDKSRLFNRKGIVDEWRDWWSRRPRLAVTHHYLHADDSVSINISGSGEVSFWYGTSAVTSVEQRLKVLENNFEILKSNQTEMMNRLNEEIKTRNEALNCERQTRERAIGDIRTLLVTFGAGGINWREWGSSGFV